MSTLYTSEFGNQSNINHRAIESYQHYDLIVQAVKDSKEYDFIIKSMPVLKTMNDVTVGIINGIIYKLDVFISDCGYTDTPIIIGNRAAYIISDDGIVKFLFQHQWNNSDEITLSYNSTLNMPLDYIETCDEFWFSSGDSQ